MCGLLHACNPVSTHPPIHTHSQRIIREEWEALQKREKEEEERRAQEKRDKEVKLTPCQSFVFVLKNILNTVQQYVLVLLCMTVRMSACRVWHPECR